MARKGENIYKRKDGRWEARYEKGRNSKGQIIYGSLYGKSYREVREKKINSIVKLPVTKTISPSESVNICDVSTRWLESIRHTVKESTYSCYLTLIQKHILTYFNNSSMITSEHIQQFINYKITNDLSPTSVRNIVVLLERILRYGEDENLLPITKRSFTFPKSSFYINDTLDASQLSILARYLYLEGDAFSVGLLLCMHTGIRIGELCGLKGGDFNFTNETFEIHRTISRIRNTESTPEHQDAKTKVIIGTPKSTSSLRTIPGNVQRRFKNILKKCDLPPVTFHSLRHSFATRCIEKGADSKALSEILGHSSVKITLDIYVHSNMEQKREYINQLTI